MTIHEVAKKLNISRRAIRFYEEKGLIAPAKQRDNRYRQFTEQEVWRLQTIITLREVGMSLDDIKAALGQIDSGNGRELLAYLDIQRSVLFAAWLEYKHQIATTDRMIDMLKQRQELALPDIYALAESSRRLRELRSHWSDAWNFDHQAATHDLAVQDDSGLYKHYEQALDIVYKWTSPQAAEQGLDIGTGTGNLAGRFVKGGIRMSAIDQSKRMLNVCQNKFPQLDTKLGNFLAIPYMDGQFDFIVSSFALHHLTDDQKMMAMEEMRRVLKPKGRICIADLMREEPDGETFDESNRRIAENRYIPDASLLLDWFETNGYMTKQRQLSDLLHIVYAVPIR
ncbi:MAG: yrrT [Paenibacillus sp.]|nr:yrrT [Paenibacillus sp.]